MTPKKCLHRAADIPRMGTSIKDPIAHTAAARRPDSTPDLRREPRFLPSRLVEILPCRGRKDWTFLSAELVDCSANGVGLIVTERLPVGEQFILKVRLAKWILLLYTVRYCEPLADRARSRSHPYRLGAELSGPADANTRHDPDAILAALIAQHQANPAV
jgi:hypothetical protein